MDSDEEDGGGKKKAKRGVLPKSATSVMKSWLFQHIVVSSDIIYSKFTNDQLQNSFYMTSVSSFLH